MEQSFEGNQSFEGSPRSAVPRVAFHVTTKEERRARVAEKQARIIDLRQRRDQELKSAQQQRLQREAEERAVARARHEEEMKSTKATFAQRVREEREQKLNEESQKKSARSRPVSKSVI